MFKPTMFSNNGIDNNFEPFHKKVSISIDMISNDSSAEYKVFVQIEPQEVKNLKQLIINHKNDYDLILAWDEDILRECQNAILFPFGTRWVRDLSVYEGKNGISILASNKQYCDGHKLRHECIRKLPLTTRSGQTIRRHVSPPLLKTKEEILRPYLFSIIIENTQHKNWFTEKLIDCLACRTVPVYWGCPNIVDFFDANGIIIFNTLQELEEIVHSLNQEKYDEMLEVVEKNFHKSLGYADLFSRAHAVIGKKL